MWLFVVLGSMLCWSCGDADPAPTAPQAMSLMRLAGSNQYGLAGEALAESLAVAVTDAAGRAVPGQRIDFEIVQGVGSLGTESAFSNAEGRASTQMTLGSDADGTVRVTATLFGTGDFVEFTATVVDPAHRPTASARADPAVIEPGAQVLLHGGDSHDPGGGSMVFRWRELSGNPYPVSFPANDAEAAFAVYVTLPKVGQYRFTLVVTNERGLRSRPDTVVVRARHAFTDMILVEGGSLPGLTVSSFYMAKYEVTWGTWQSVRRFAAGSGYDLDGIGRGCSEDHPVYHVNWYDAVKWCNALSEKEGRSPVYMVAGRIYRTGEHDDVTVNGQADGYRLPTEAEWEFASRGGIYSRDYRYSGSDILDEVAWYVNNSMGAECGILEGRGPWPVGLKMPNELGLYDMSGNVWEWCFDASNSVRRMLRGGGWFDHAEFCRVASRGSSAPGGRFSYSGFRLAANAGP